jgi:Cu(I)/Ag(I) efflux system membrane fusion protein
MLSLRFSLSALLVVLAIGVAGCKSQVSKEQNQSAPPASPVKEASAEEGAADISSGLAELSVEDRELAKKQRICPVSGEVLGAMGKPIKITIKGKTVFLCCDGCEKELKENPDKYLAKLKTP